MSNNVIQVADFPIMIKIKKSGLGKYKSYGCGKDSVFSFKYENTEELDTGCKVKSYADRLANFKTNFYRVLDPEVLEMSQDSTRVTIPSGAYSVDEKHTVPSDKIIQLPYISNDDTGITSVVIKSEDGSTIYVADTDYTVSVTDKRTTITVIGTNINAGDVIAITGTVNMDEAYKHDISLGKTVLPNFDIRLEGYKTIDGKKYMFVLDAESGSQVSEYVIKFLNKNKGGIPEGTELSFDFATDDIKIIDQISPAEAKL